MLEGQPVAPPHARRFYMKAALCKSLDGPAGS